MIVKVRGKVCPYCRGKKSEASMKCYNCQNGITQKKNKRKAIGRISRWQQSRKASLRDSMELKKFSFKVYSQKLNEIRGVV